VYQGDELWSGVAIGDFDNDGDQDVFVPQIYDVNYAPSYLFRNNKDNTFSEISQSMGVRVFNNYGAAWCDYNNDGFIDLITGGKSPFIAEGSGSYEIHLFKNNGNKNNWLKIRLSGTESNNAGIGARIILTTNLGTQYKQVDGGTGSHSQQNGLVVHFGLGSATTVSQVNVEWTSGRGVIFNSIPINQEIMLVEEQEGPIINSISVSKNILNEDESVNFDGSAVDPDGTVTKYEWDFDGDNKYDFSSSTSAKATHTYTRSGKYFAKFRVWDDSGRFYTYKTTGQITVKNIKPTAVAGNDRVVYEDENITFNGNLSLDSVSDQANLEYNWSFGDDTYSDWNSSPLMNHSYSENGIYQVTLTVRDDDNETDVDSLQVTVRNWLPSCRVIAERLVMEDTTVLFTAVINDSVSDLPFIQYRWVFGDGNNTYWSLNPIVEHLYTMNGTYTVQCVVRDDDWPEDENFTEFKLTVYNVAPNCTIEADEEVDEDVEVYFYSYGWDTPSDNNELKFLWDFDDWSNSGWLKVGYQNITHVYPNQGIYHAKLIVMDDDSATCERTVNITVNNVRPKCIGMDEDSLEVNEDELISFYGSGTDTSSDKDTLAFSWNLDIPGMKNTSWEKNAELEFAYDNMGEYTAVLTVRDDNGEVDTFEVDIRVLNIKPEAIFLASETSVNEDENIYFNASRSTDSTSDLPLLNYTWDFIDESLVLFGPWINRTFRESGEFRVKLKVTDDNSEFDVVTQKIRVKNVKPVAEIIASKTKTFVEVPITFSGINSSDTSSDLPELTYRWDFGDGKIENGILVTHSFDKKESYNVQLTVKDDDGAEGVANIQIKIEELTGKDAGDRSETDSADHMNAMIIDIILVVVLLLIIFFYLRKRKKDSEKEFETNAELESDNKSKPGQDMDKGNLSPTDRSDTISITTTQSKPTPTATQMPGTGPIPPQVFFQQMLQNQMEMQMQQLQQAQQQGGTPQWANIQPWPEGTEPIDYQRPKTAPTPENEYETKPGSDENQALDQDKDTTTLEPKTDQITTEKYTESEQIEKIDIEKSGDEQLEVKEKPKSLGPRKT
jgi:PKD repeat protein